MTKFLEYQKIISILVIISFLETFILDIQVYALTGHNSMPEYRSFEPVETTNMVNLFDGSFVYNIPLLNIPNGYPISLSYHSNDVNNEAQASWVGLGWTLNPGAINRVRRGFPDEFKGVNVRYHNRIPANWTGSFTVGVGAELFGEELGIDVGLDATIRYNNYKGIGRELSGGIVGPAGVASLNFTYSAGEFGFNPTINPAAILMYALSDRNATTGEKNKGGISYNLSYSKGNFGFGLSGLDKSVSYQVNYSKGIFNFGLTGQVTTNWRRMVTGSSFGFSERQPRPIPIPTNKYEGAGLNLGFDAGINFLPVPIDPEVRLKGSYVRQWYGESRDMNAYGYMNSEGANESDFIMDYHVENETPYEKRNRFLGVPLPDYDIFGVTGEAMGGSFRAFRSDFGHYKKADLTSKTYMGELEVDINMASHATPVGLANEVYTYGGTIGGSYSELKLGDWKDNRGNVDQYAFRDDSDFKNRNDEKFILRYSGDLAGSFDLAVTDEAIRANLSSDGLDISGFTHLTHRNLRSSYIEINKTSDFEYTAMGDVRYKVHEPNLWIKSGSKWNDYNLTRTLYSDNNNDPIGEIATYNSDGVRYVYGLPIYTRNEKQLQYSLGQGDYSGNNGLIVDVTTSNLDGNAESKVGYEMDSPYANQFLLTQITNSDYIDRTFNGPTPDDFGSYTRFNYIRFAGGNGSWYKYRSPYSGLSFNYGSLSDNNDDMGSFSFGEKEIYYLHSIASKTHVAIFYLEDRDDGMSAPVRGETPSLNQIIRAEDSDTDRMKLKCLSKIELYSIADCETVTEEISGTLKTIPSVYLPKTQSKPIKTVHFEYDYSLCKNIPNNSTGLKGKLTLKKVWFEYEGKITSKISPYVFHYQYPTLNYPDPYESFENFGSGKIENPDYNVLNTDRWGNYRDYNSLVTPSKLGNLARFFPFTYQGQLDNFDPGAWCLKRIVLPSGGEIHIQYEQHDYQYVQNKRAMVMVPLLRGNTSDTEDSDFKKYFIDLTKIGINTTPTQELVDELFEPMKGKEEEHRLYFNFLYRLVENQRPDFTNNKSDYIEGFARISGYGIKNGKAFFVFKKNSNTSNGCTYFVPLDYEDYNAREIPQKVCEEFYLHNRQGKLTGASNALDDEDDGESILNTMASIAEQALGVVTKCKQIAPEMSYVRLQLPLIKSKKGGGVRVKRLLMYDDGSGMTSLPSLYGKEYRYKTEVNLSTDKQAGFSSGVATNEPVMGRRESPLVYPIDKEEKSDFEAILYGRDIYNNEGPFGESLLPAPSIGYSKVIIENIHKGKTSTGYEIHEFLTCKDYPFQFKSTNMKKNQSGTGNIGAGIGKGPVSVSGSYGDIKWKLTQGYRFISNDAHGKIRRIAKFALGTNEPIEEELYEYFPIGQRVKVMDENFIISEMVIGKESEVLAEMKEVFEYTAGASFGVDVSAGVLITFPIPPFVPPIPIPVIIGTKVNLGAFYNASTLRTHVTTKIIHYPIILKKITRIRDGIKHIQDNFVFDKFTGHPIITRSCDDFGNSLIRQEFKASHKYANLKSKSINQKMTAKDAVYSITDNGREYIEFTGVGAECGQAQKFITGDQIEFILEGNNDPSNATIYHVDSIDVTKDRLYIIKSALNNFDISAGSSIPIVQILRSGYTNQLNAQMGNLLIHTENASNGYYENRPTSIIESDHPFIVDLNWALDNQLSGTSSRVVTLPGQYENMTTDLDECILDGSCGDDNEGITLSNVRINFDFTTDARTGSDVMIMKVLGFDASKPQAGITQTISIDCERDPGYNIKEVSQKYKLISSNNYEGSHSIVNLHNYSDRACKKKYPECTDSITASQGICDTIEKGKNSSNNVKLYTSNSIPFPEDQALLTSVGRNLFIAVTINSQVIVCDTGEFIITGPNSNEIYMTDKGERIDVSFDRAGNYRVEYNVEIGVGPPSDPCSETVTETVYGWICVLPEIQNGIGNGECGSLNCNTYGGVGITTDSLEKIWIQLYGFTERLIKFSGDTIMTSAIYVLNKDGTQTDFSPIQTITVNGDTDTLLKVNRGLRTDHDGNIIVASGDMLYKLNYKTGEGINKVVPQINKRRRQSINEDLVTPAIDAKGYLYTRQLTSGWPIRIFDSNFNFIAIAADSVPGNGRSIEVSSDGNTIFDVPSDLGGIRIWQNEKKGSKFVLKDTILNDWRIESIKMHPTSNNLWVGTTSKFGRRYNELLNDKDLKLTTWYEYDQKLAKVVDSIKWRFRSPSDNIKSPRGIAFSKDGKAAYITCLASKPDNFSTVQKFNFSKLIHSNISPNWIFSPYFLPENPSIENFKGCCEIPKSGKNFDKPIGLLSQNSSEPFPEDYAYLTETGIDLQIKTSLSGLSNEMFCDEGRFTVKGPLPSESVTSYSGPNLLLSFAKPGLYNIEFRRNTKNTSRQWIDPCKQPLPHTVNGWICVYDLKDPDPTFRLFADSSVCPSKEFIQMDDILSISGFPGCSNGIFEYCWAVKGPGIVQLKEPNMKNPLIKFNTAGKYTIQLVVTNYYGDQYCREIDILVVDCIPGADIRLKPPSCDDFGKILELAAISNTQYQIDSYVWDLGDGSIKTGQNIEHEYTDCEPHIITLTVSNDYGHSETKMIYPGNSVFYCHKICDCQSEINVAGASALTNQSNFTSIIGKFYLREDKSTIVFRQPECPILYIFDCISICGEEDRVAPDIMDNIVSASATTFSDDWSYLSSSYSILPNDFVLNDFENGSRGKWRPFEEYSYRETLNMNGEDRNFMMGKFKLKVFNWTKPEENNPLKWINTSTITKYSPNGDAIEDRNILGVFSTARYGYNHALPILVSQNARDNSVTFESFENVYLINGINYLENGIVIDLNKITNDQSHTGYQSLIMDMNNSTLLGIIDLTGNIRDKGLLIRAWLKSMYNQKGLDGHVKLFDNGNPENPIEMGTMKKISDAGDWSLFEGVISNLQLSGIVSPLKIGLLIDPGYVYFGPVYVDDFRAQPVDAEMVCYVYDSAQRLIAVLDDQHFALLYEYNSEGLLTRKLKETIEGIKTVSETQYNTSGEVRR